MSDYKTRMSPNGRILIPASLRKKLKFSAQQKLLIRVIDGHLEIFSSAQGVAMAQSLLKRRLKPGVRLAKELIDDRKKEQKNG